MFIYLSTEADLGFFHLSAIVNTTRNMGVQISVQVPAINSSGATATGRPAGSHGPSRFDFLGGAAILFSVAAAPPYPRTSSVQEFVFPHILTNMYYFLDHDSVAQ